MAAAAALLCAAAVCGLAHAEPAPSSGSGPGSSRCRQPYLEDQFTGCIVDRRADLPLIRPGATFEVFAAEHYLTAVGRIAEWLSFTHMGLWLRETSGGQGERMSVVLEYAAIKFGDKALFPETGPGGELLWDNRAKVAWYPEANKTEWLAKAKLTRVGTVGSIALEKWFRWILDWSGDRQGYNLWSIWDRPDVAGARRLLPDSICHTFVEDGLAEMYRLGAQLDQEEPICRNYFSFIDTVGGLRTVDILDKSVHEDVTLFYRDFKGLIDRPYKDLLQFGRSVVDLVSSLREGPHFYVYQVTSSRALPKYWLANLSRPYFSQHVNQRMILPWQNVSLARSSECRRRTFLSPDAATAGVLERILV